MRREYHPHAEFTDYEMIKTILKLAGVRFEEVPDLHGTPCLLKDTRKYARWMMNFAANEKFLALHYNEDGFRDEYGRPAPTDLVDLGVKPEKGYVLSFPKKSFN